MSLPSTATPIPFRLPRFYPIVDTAALWEGAYSLSTVVEGLLDGGREPVHLVDEEDRMWRERGQEGGNGLCPRFGKLAMLFFDVVVIVPRLPGAAPDLHDAHAALEQAHGENLQLRRDLARLGWTGQPATT